VLAYSCETYEVAEPTIDNTFPAYVELASSAAQTVPEGGNIMITLSSRTVVYEAYSVTYEITGDYTASGTIEVEKGVNQVQVPVPVAAGIVTDEPLSATLTLTGVNGNLNLGRNGENLSVEISITKFVPFEAVDYAITFNCDEPGYKIYQCEFVTTDDPNVLTNTNFYDSGWLIDYTFSADFEQIVTIEEQTIGVDADALTISGSGTYDGVTKTMVVDYAIVQADGTVYEENTHTFTVPGG
jgi:hypothetical protein